MAKVTTASTLTTDVLPRTRPNAKLIALLAAGHLVVDVNQGSLSAVLPFLRAAHGLSYAQAGSIVPAPNNNSSIVHPGFGYLSDPTPRPWLLSLAGFVTRVGLGLTR